MKKILAGLILLLGTTIGCAPHEHFAKLAREVQPKAVMIEVDTVVEQLTMTFDDGVLNLHVSTAPAKFLGAGVFISPRGHILTCAHLFTHQPINGITVFDVNGSSMPVSLLYMDEGKDLALVKLDLNYLAFSKFPLPTYAALTDESLVIGQEVLAVGNPLGLSFSVSHGIISAFRPGFDNGYNFTQDDAAINHGNSGGPLFNLRGELIGINTLKADDGEGLSFAVSPETIREFLNLFRGLN